MATARFHDQPLDLPYLAVGRTDGQFAVYAYPAGWDVVDGDLLRGFRFARPGCLITAPSTSTQFTFLGALSGCPCPVGSRSRTLSVCWAAGASGTRLGSREAGSGPS
jgi:hypothetical protein